MDIYTEELLQRILESEIRYQDDEMDFYDELNVQEWLKKTPLDFPLEQDEESNPI